MKPLSEQIDSAIQEFGQHRVLLHICNTDPEKTFRYVTQQYAALPESEPITTIELQILTDIVSHIPMVLVNTIRTSIPVNHRSIASVAVDGLTYHVVRRT